jgi:hypothetical protein
MRAPIATKVNNADLVNQQPIENSQFRKAAQVMGDCLTSRSVPVLSVEGGRLIPEAHDGR